MTSAAASKTVPTAPLYIVMRDFGKLGFESVTDPDMTRASIAGDIATGQIDRVAYVIEAFPLEGSSRDITDDIFEAARKQAAAMNAAYLEAAE